MSKAKANPQPKFLAEILCGLSDGTAVFIKRQYHDRLSMIAIGEDLEKLAWIETPGEMAVRPSQIVSIKQITWSEL